MNLLWVGAGAKEAKKKGKKCPRKDQSHVSLWKQGTMYNNNTFYLLSSFSVYLKTLFTS